VTAESAPGRGTTFTVALSLGSAHLRADQIGDDRGPAAAGAEAGPFGCPSPQMHLSGCLAS
jgi:hypothetical protein